MRKIFSGEALLVLLNDSERVVVSDQTINNWKRS